MTQNTGDAVPALLSGATGSWQLDPTRTTIELRTKAMWGLVKVRGTLKAVEGSAVVGADGSLTGTLTVDANSIDTKNNKRDVHLRSGDFFEVEKYPTFTYSATGASPTADGKLTLTGTLTIRDQARPLNVVATVTEPSSGRVVLKADVEIDRSQWGMTWAKMGAGLVNQLAMVAQFTRS